jgi:hypothetical protein
MPLFNFQKQFSADVEMGKKRQTIRAKRKTRPKPGQIAYLYTGARTKSCRKLGEAEIVEVSPILIGSKGLIINYGEDIGECIENKPQDLDCFAREDGFKDWSEMRDWSAKTHGLPFEGDLIKW